MRDELASTANEPPARITPGLHAELHYSPSELAELWGLSSDTIRRLFEDEPGVVTIGERNPRRKRRYVTLRIPQSVAALGQNLARVVFPLM
jgi:hypothetical protein